MLELSAELCLSETGKPLLLLLVTKLSGIRMCVKSNKRVLAIQQTRLQNQNKVTNLIKVKHKTETSFNCSDSQGISNSQKKRHTTSRDKVW